MSPSTLIDLGPQRYDLRFVQGDDVSFEIRIGGNRAAYTFTSKLRPWNGLVTTAFTATPGAYDNTPSQQFPSGFTPVTVVLSDATSGGLAVGQYVWDLQWNNGGAIRTIAGGDLEVLAQVT